MSRAIVTTMLALGIGLAASTASQAAAVPAMGSGLAPALAAAGTVEKAQVRVRRGVVVGPRGGVAVGRRATIVGPGGGVAVRRGAIVAPRVVGVPRAYVGRPFRVYNRSWVRRPYFGTIVGGVALGTILAVTAAPRYAPAPGLCWNWVDDFEERGYWDYCY
jgi:hypothetical protein